MCLNMYMWFINASEHFACNIINLSLLHKLEYYYFLPDKISVMSLIMIHKCTVNECQFLPEI